MNLSQHLKKKINDRVLELFEKGHTNDDMDNINIRSDIIKKLLPYQTLHTFNMISALKNNNTVIDSSYTGTGKTYTTIAACAQLNLIPFVICPKNIINYWKNIIYLFGLNYLSVVNYETIKTTNYYDLDGNKKLCPYIKKDNKSNYTWDFTSYPNHKRIVIIFDEVHKCKSPNSQNGKLLISAKGLKTMLLSATLCDKTSDFGIFGMMLGFYNNPKQGHGWIQSIMREDKNQFGKKVNTLHKYLFPSKGSKMSLEDFDDSFPMNQITMDCYNLPPDDLKKINLYYQKITEEVTTENKLVEIIAMRQKIENIKSQILIELMIDYYEQNKSVVVFVNYTSTYKLIFDHLKKHNIQCAEINGEQDIFIRQKNIDMFQNNEVRILISMIQAGGTSIGLHDISGSFPRVSIISPSYSRIELVQTLGRIFRAGVRSPCLQKIVYCADTCEEDLANILKAKKNTLDKITDEDVFIGKSVTVLNKNLHPITNDTFDNTILSNINNEKIPSVNNKTPKNKMKSNNDIISDTVFYETEFNQYCDIPNKHLIEKYDTDDTFIKDSKKIRSKRSLFTIG